MGSGLSFSGLFSNLDTESIITQLMYLERAPVRLLEKKQLKLGYEKEQLQSVNNSLLALKTSIQSFKTSGIAYDNTLTSEDESVVTGSATTAATEGKYQVKVLALAEENIIGSYTKADTWTFGASSGGLPGVFEITTENAGGPVFSINVNAADDMEAIVSTINSAVNGPDNLTDFGAASLINDPATGNQTIVLKANDTGIANRLWVQNVAGGNNAAGVIGLRQGGTVNQLQTAKDASVEIDGLTVSSSTNLMEGAITGVSLNLHKTNAVAIDVRVGLNDDDIVAKASDFVTQFNSTTKLMSQYLSTKPVQDPTTEAELKAGILFGDYDLVSTKSDIRLKTTGYVDAGLADYQLLAQIGISSEASFGSFVSSDLQFDEDQFRTAIANNKDEVVALLAGWADELDAYLEDQTNVSVISSDAGNFYRRQLSIDSRIDDIDDNISSWEDRLLSMEDRMRADFTAMEQALQKMQSQSNYLTSQLSSLQTSMKASK